MPLFGAVIHPYDVVQRFFAVVVLKKKTLFFSPSNNDVTRTERCVIVESGLKCGVANWFS